MSLFTCRTCTDPEYSDTPNSTARLTLGGVHSVKESVYAPYRRIFLEQETTGPSQWALSDGVNARIANHRRYRPCVLQESVKARRPRRSAPYIYLMATYKGNNVSDLPWFFRFFSFPVSPNLLLHDMNLDGTHFHTTPEWPDGKPQWLIIIPIRTTKIHPRTPPWPASRNLQTVRYAFGPKALDHIASLWGSRSLEWQTMCEDPDFLPRQAALLNEHEAEERAKDRSAVTSYGDEVSVNTMGTSKWSMHTMHVPPSDMMAIPEGETLDEVTGDDTAPVPGKMDGPMLQVRSDEILLWEYHVLPPMILLDRGEVACGETQRRS
ncbi:hypothetical protein K466DRAFT_567542 [Polyporus arcularius HHB13444]|uniref:Uncharacterized protein n=1 Tax=Polyporus arcularius HHB13444 TaxID=1314778 RepID=A0A5C3P357_9APHY|nr:hypothetical protein K466DRAFT_567542 [Polyporus arcularius HHB13444]